MSSGGPSIAVTGATGFLGRHIVRALIDGGWSVRAIARPAARRAVLADLPLSWYATDDAGLAQAVAGATAVVHLATCYGRAGETLGAVLEANYVLPIRLMGAAQAAGVPRALIAGTALPRTLSPYALAKHQAGEWAPLFPSLATTSLDLQHFYGPGDDVGKFTARVITACARGEGLDLTDGTQERDFIYIDDAVAAILAVLNSQAAPPTVAIGSGRAMPVRSFVEAVHARTGRRSALRFGAVPTRVGEPDRLVADTTELRRLGWQPTTDLDVGITHCLAALKDVP